MKRRDALLLCNRWLPLWTGNQPERLIEVYSDDAFYRDPAKPEGIRGKSNLLLYFRKLLAAFPDWVWEAKDVFPIQGGFVLRWKATIPVADAVVVEQGLDLVLTEEGKIIRNEVYLDRSALLAALAKRGG
jgi:hypothetical protein